MASNNPRPVQNFGLSAFSLALLEFESDLWLIADSFATSRLLDRNSEVTRYFWPGL